jgi:signal transduction histidine kinase
MSVFKWLLDKKVYFIIFMGYTSILLLFMSAFGMNKASVLFILLISFLAHLSYLLYEYFRRYRYYKRIHDQFNDLDQKHLIQEIMESPYFFEGEFLYDLIQGANKSMNDQIGLYKERQKSYRMYIETWVHEIKTPISAGQLILKNHPYQASESLNEELEKIDGYVEQALYFARGHQLEKDYMIKEVNLLNLIGEVLKKHARKLIELKCQINLFDQDLVVKTDEKWMVFILSQIINNSIQYSYSPMKLDFKVKSLASKVVLSITDYGIGIKKKDLLRVFDQGFTGSNGRKEKKSTGIGLYLCKHLCHQMGLGIEVKSQENVFTQVSIHFPYSNMYD